MGYVYQADIYCDDCGDNIRGELHAQGKAPEDVMDTASFDSDDFPKPYDHRREESNTPSHCAQCDKMLRNPLTSDGYEYVRAALSELPALTTLTKLQDAGHPHLADWASWYAFRYWDQEDCEYFGHDRKPGWYSPKAF